MTVLIALLLTALTVAFVAYPFFRQRLRSIDSTQDNELHSRRDTVYSMLKELEFDFQSGILTEEDYRDLESRYKGKAVSILKDIDNLNKDSDVEEEIEKGISELRRSKGRFCPQCGESYQDEDRFCSHCGANLRGEGAN